ncbi:MAG TPA: glycosyl hydrolase, partial [Dinghuibacter sp.]|uniref:glycosyl hydrolase n=1 Tax=Dinghuibacter sp. TaxID=2024697 RepID=UPI002CC8A70C
AMKRAGINRAFIAHVGVDGTAPGTVRLFSPEWWDILHTALKTASRLHIAIGMFDAPGWSGMGGPWVKPGQAMRYLTASETGVRGPGVIDTLLGRPAEPFQDVRVIAYPRPLGTRLGEAVSFRFPEPADSLVVGVAGHTTVRSLVLRPEDHPMRLEGTVEASENGVFRPIGNFTMDRSNPALNTGFEPYGPLAVSLPATTADSFRVVFRHWTKGSALADMDLSGAAVVGNYVEKTLGKMHPNPHPFWYAYQWPIQPEVTDNRYMVDPAQVIDISSSMDSTGRLRWRAPAGDWVVLRTGMTPTKVVNSPASPEATGLQGDKLNKQHVAASFDAFIGEILWRIPAEDRTCFQVVVEDSYEVGGLNWTDDMATRFKARYGYDPVPYIPVMMGYVVGSEDKSDRFLWDLRRFIADGVAYDYVGGLRELAHRHGLTNWLENYGHWGFPAEFLQYGGQSDEVGGEFWAEGDLGDIENRAASSSAHIYGKNKVSAESFTAGGGTYARYPALLKPRADRFFTEGINNTLLHVYISQPDDRLPGVNTWFGTEFNRHNTWFGQLDVFTTYLKRCNFLLRQGRYVADVAYFIGEDAPKMIGVTSPLLPRGYSYDYINAEVILHRLSVVAGRWTLPDGLSYKVLVLPPLKTMRPEVLARLDSLVALGGVLLGPAPERSPSLQDYGRADARVRSMALTLWQSPRVYNGVGLDTVFARLRILPDMAGPDSVLFIHRTLSDRDIYFVSNQTAHRLDCTPAFRVQGASPVLWDPVTGETRALPRFSVEGGVTRVPLRFERYQSYFVVFGRGGGVGAAERDGGVATNFPSPKVVLDVRGPWKVSFDTAMRGPAGPVVLDTLSDWGRSLDTAIRYYSGKAIYRCDFRVDAVYPKGKRVWLDLGSVMAMAKVRVNGVYAGGAWTPPYRVDISGTVRKGMNHLEVEVVNTWVNRLIGDSRLPVKDRRTWMDVDPYGPGDACVSSGLLGPVRICVGGE